MVILPVLGQMPDHWRTVTLGSLLDGGTRNGIYKAKQFHGSGTRVVNMGELFAHPRLFDIPMKRLKLTGAEQDSFSLRPGDLLFARRSLVAEGAGKCTLVCEINEPTVFESSIIRARPKADVADSRYLFYLFSSPYGSYVLGTILRQVAVSGVTGRDLIGLQVPLPPIEEQREIARCLELLDDKIDLNRRMNQTLEALAAAVFKAWFVDFEPVRAKMEGRRPFGMDDETAALFPDSFEDSEIGQVPKGWKTEPIGEAVAVVGGSTPSTSNLSYWERGTLSWATPRDLSRLETSVLLETERKITEAGLQQISSGLLPPGTVLLSSRAPIGYLAVSEMPVAVNQGFIAMVCGKELSNHYVLLWAKASLEAIIARSNGTTFLEISKASFRPIPVLVPSANVLSAFEVVVEPLFQRLITSVRESRTLAALRDTLLPKLLSGEIRVRDAEREVAVAV